MYSRGAASDLDDWERDHANPGWAFADMLPMFQKLETYEIDKGARNHGFAGPLHISRGGDVSKMSQEWLNTALSYDKTRGFVSDLNDFVTANGYGPLPKWINRKGVRHDAAHLYLYPAVHKAGSNIRLLADCTVSRVILEGNRAVGVEYLEGSTRKVTMATKLVVISSGAFGSPQILERSGIGSPEVLEAAGVKVNVPLQGVGNNYQDHNLMATVYLAETGGLRDAYLRGESMVVESAKLQYERDGSGVLGTNGIDVGAKLRPTAEDLRTLGDAMNKEWPYFEKAQDKPLLFHGVISAPLVADGFPQGEHITTFAYSGYPFSRGSVHIRSSDPSELPRFDPGLFTHPADVPPLMWEYKLAREIVRRMPSYRGEFVAAHPVFPEGSEAAASADCKPVPVDAPDIVYTAEDDEALDRWIRTTVRTMWHSMGTCAMKPQSQGGVLDPRLNVYGVEGLKVADISICPANISANTAGTALAIGEKAAVIIAEDLGIQGV
ncbi:hypothetical protein AURDEDRAFT_115327 [Auricularia subglabra TFB-10046 SS5]|nr:hypothetical protein AURDEDRAFT_115327 [Auricularia subglabra TFB-10046 SS5]